MDGQCVRAGVRGPDALVRGARRPLRSPAVRCWSAWPCRGRITVAGAFRRSELVGLQIVDVTRHRHNGLHVRVRPSKTDRDGNGFTCALPRTTRHANCSPCAYSRWLQVVAAFDRGGRPGVIRLLRTAAEFEAHVCMGTRRLLTCGSRVPLGPAKLQPLDDRPVGGRGAQDDPPPRSRGRLRRVAGRRSRRPLAPGRVRYPGVPQRRRRPRDMRQTGTPARRCSRCMPASTPPDRKRRHPDRAVVVNAANADRSRFDPFRSRRGPPLPAYPQIEGCVPYRALMRTICCAGRTSCTSSASIGNARPATTSRQWWDCSARQQTDSITERMRLSRNRVRSI